MDGLLGSYVDSDEEKASAAAPVAAGKAAAGGPPAKKARTQEPPLKQAEAAPVAAPQDTVHGPLCDCDRCTALLARFVAKSTQVKGIRFKCKLCNELAKSKDEASEHLQILHNADLQFFKKQKEPKLFEVAAAKFSAAKKKISFAKDDVLKPKFADEDKSFGGWSKKEKPEPPPCERPEHQNLADPIITTPPWYKAQRPSDEKATAIDKEVDERILKAQMRRFSSRNVLEVNAATVRCKLCYKTLDSTIKCQKHIVEDHREDFAKELGVWERYLHTNCKRQPPFGWTCKVCNLYFANDGDTWRHTGNEVFIRQDERHVASWHEREDRWGHEEDAECQGDGLSAGGMSWESIQKFNEEARKLDEHREARDVDRGNAPGEEEEDEDDKAEPVTGEVKYINEF